MSCLNLFFFNYRRQFVKLPILHSFEVEMLKASVVLFAFMVVSVVAPKVRHRSLAKDPPMDIVNMRSFILNTKIFDLVNLTSKRKGKDKIYLYLFVSFLKLWFCTISVVFEDAYPVPFPHEFVETLPGKKSEEIWNFNIYLIYFFWFVSVQLNCL